MESVDEKLETGWLFAFYGPLLTSRQQKLIALYCEEDFSLSEIAAREGISRQGVYDAVRKGAAQLAAYHSKARESTNVPVDYTLVKHVSKPAGAKPGMVIYVKNNTLYVTPAATVVSPTAAAVGSPPIEMFTG